MIFFQTNFIRLGAKHYWDFHCNQPTRIGHFHSVSLWNGFTVKAIGCLIIAIIIYNLRLENCCSSMWLIASDYPLWWHCGAKLYKIQYINTTTNENGSAFYKWMIITLVDIYMRLIRFPNCYLASSVLLTWESASASLSTISPMVKPRGEITIPEENPFSNDSYTKKGCINVWWADFRVIFRINRTWYNGQLASCLGCSGWYRDTKMYLLFLETTFQIKWSKRVIV